MLLILLALLSSAAILSPASAAPAAPGAPGPRLALAGGAQPPLQATPEPTSDRSRYPRGESNVTFRWDVLVDTLALLVARFWVCCGGLVVLAIPVFFGVLWVKSQNRKRF